MCNYLIKTPVDFVSHDSHRLHLWVHDTICIVSTILFSNHSPALCHHSGDCIGILLLILLLCPPGVIVDNLKGDMSELRCRATFWKRRRKVQLEIKRTNANISVSRGKCTILYPRCILTL